MALWTAFTIGFLGSLHCLGMCGPIAMTLSLQTQGRRAIVLNGLTYNFGRILTYSILGMAVGMLGKGLFLAGIQKGLSLAIGIALLIAVFFSINLEKKIFSLPLVNLVFFKLKIKLGQLLDRNAKPSFFLTGILNGLLPCGLVYLAIVGAVSTGSAWNGLLYMTAFGLGTLPLMFVSAVAGKFISINLRSKLRRLYPIFLSLLAILFIFRGLQFSVPQGFSFWDTLQYIPMCH